MKDKNGGGKRSPAGLLFLIGGFALGLLLGSAFMSILDGALEGANTWWITLLLLATLYGSFLLQIILHESGHLLFGLLTGYRFGSFRVFNLMWVKERGKLRLRKLSLAGTAGQCLMAPPDMVNGSFPVVLYNLGGVLMNLIVAAIAIIVAGLIHSTIASAVLWVFAVVGIGFAVLNGYPFRVGNVDNDGRNVMSLRKNPAARKAFWTQMKIGEQVALGKRLGEMPEEWFHIENNSDRNNALIATIEVFAANRLMEEHRFAEAEELMADLMLRSGALGVHRNLMTCDRIFIELIGEGRADVIEGWLQQPELKTFMKSMKRFPTVMRTVYALALLHEKNQNKAAKLLHDFEKIAVKYPYPSDIENERRLMALAKEKQEG